MGDQDLLDDIIFTHRHPQYQGKIAHISPLTDGNPSCGDQIKLYLDIKDDIIIRASYTGQLCSIATYGAERLASAITDKPLADALDLSASDLLPHDCPLLSNPTRLTCFTTAQRALQSLTKITSPKRGDNKIGESGGTRTHDTRLKRPVL